MSFGLGELGVLSTTLIGGLALFLFGMDVMTQALKQLAGSSMKTILARMTGNRVTGLVAGATVTAIIQSSSVTTVLLVGFISAGLMTTGQSVAVILGANIGSTVTAQILAFKVSALALPMLATGFFVSFLSGPGALREWGRILLGLGLIFFGMSTMSDAVTPLRDVPEVVTVLASLDNVFLAALVGTVLTGLLQSSAVTTGILIIMTGQGLLTLETAIAIALGANIGTCVTALLAAIGQPRAAVRAAIVHVLFNVIGVLIWIGFVDRLGDLARAMSPGTVPRQLANAHTMFNVINAFLFLGFTSQLNRLSEWLVPERPEKIEPRFAPRHLDPKFLDVPAIALDAVRLEVLHLSELVGAMIDRAVPTVISGSPLELDRLYVMDRPVDLLHREIVGYLRRISLGSLPDRQSARLMAYLRIANDLEHVADQVSRGLVISARKRIEEDVVISPQTARVIAGLHRQVIAAFDGICEALDQQDAARATAVREMKAEFNRLMEQASSHQVERLRADEPRRLQTYAREIELVERLDDIFKIVRRIARTEMSIFEGAAQAEEDSHKDVA